MIFGIGTDIIDVHRVAIKLKAIDGLMNQLFSEAEIMNCESKRYPEQHFAGKFAAKEAFFKAMGTGWGSGYAFDQIEILNSKSGVPEITTNGKVHEFININKITKIHVSIAHIKETAIATVILEI